MLGVASARPNLRRYAIALAWLAAIIYSEAMTAKNNGESLDLYLFAETILNQAEIISSGNDESVAQRFGYSYNDSIIKGLVSSYNTETQSYLSYKGDFYDEFMLSLEDGSSSSIDKEIAEQALSAVSDALLRDDASYIKVELYYRGLETITNAFHADVVVTNTPDFANGPRREVYWGGPEFPVFQDPGNIIPSVFGNGEGRLIARRGVFEPTAEDYPETFYNAATYRQPTIVYEAFASYDAQDIEINIYAGMREMASLELEYDIFGPNSNTMARYSLLNANLIDADYLPQTIFFPPILPGWSTVTSLTPDPPSNPNSKP